MIASGSQIRAARAGLGGSQEQLAGRAGMRELVRFRAYEIVAWIEGHGETRH